jgi:sulfur-oxidizing protein SoxY
VYLRVSSAAADLPAKWCGKIDLEDETGFGLTRRSLLVAGSAGMAAAVFLSPESARASDEAIELIEQLMGGTLAESPRLHLDMPAVFPTGYTVPMTIVVDTPMTEFDHVRQVRVFAPKNPIVEVAGFRFTPLRSVARVSTRIRLAAPQYVVAVAEMNDGAFLMTRTWVDVATNGCT